MIVALNSGVGPGPDKGGDKSADRGPDKGPDKGADIFLQPGDWYFGEAGTQIRTLLGSCVAVTLWHPRQKRGGMCHYMLPGTHPDRNALNGRYGEDALQLLMQAVARHGDRPGEYETKLFGGADMFGVHAGNETVAERNVKAARVFAARYGLKVKSHSLGGTCYRQLVFNLADGNVWVRQGTGANCEDVA
ncbi:chemotaxis protein CheD [Marinobacter fonticola]|uniref:chemotaxis protein CheD n=1 Tax=Marinobacter fonticola TaxID=2603215 RepID=UPI0011E7F7FA|nr:chemotaxis protein CheD [Marinobacter fonticola]